jgi:hypothetical protein
LHLAVANSPGSAADGVLGIRSKESDRIPTRSVHSLELWPVCFAQLAPLIPSQQRTFTAGPSPAPFLASRLL